MSNHDIEYYMENVVINRNDLYINFDKFTSGKSNIILITGFSGSGKTTLAKKIASEYKCDDYIELDCLDWWFAKSITIDKLKEGIPACYDFLMSHKKYLEMEKRPKLEELGRIYEEFIPYVISWCKKRTPKKYVIEGIQLYERYHKGDKFPYSGYPMVLKGTSGLKSCYQACKRDNMSIRDVPEYLDWMFRDNKQIEALYKAMKEEYDKEESVMESSNDPILSYLEKYGDSTMYVESGNTKTRYNDKGEKIPDICTKCGGKIGIFIQGEPVYLCKNCKKYFGTMKFPSKKKSKPVTESVDQECDYVFTEDSKFDFEKAICGTDYVKNLRKVDILNAKLKNKKITQEQFDKEYAKISTVNANGFVMTIPKNGSEGGKPKVVRPNKDKPGNSFKDIKKDSNDKSSYNGNIKSKSDAEKFDHYNDILRRTEDYREYKDAFKNMARLLGNPNACTIKITPNSRGGKINGESFNSKQSAGCSSSDKLYHTSNQKGITRLNGKFRGHEGFYFSSKRVYFHKNNPGSISTSSNSDYIAKDGEYVYQFMGNPSSAFVDPEIKGSAVFIETDTSIPVKDVTDQFKKKSKSVQESAESDYSYTKLSSDSELKDYRDCMKSVFHSKDVFTDAQAKKWMYVIKYKNEVIGFIGFSHYTEKGRKLLGLGNFMIKPEYQDSGHGTNFIRYLIDKNKDECDEIYCYVEKKNTRAIELYKKIGYVNTNNLTKYGYYVCLYKKEDEVIESFDETSFEFDDAFFEEALKDTTILRDRLYPKVEECLKVPANVKKLKKIISDFVEKNTDKLTTPGPQYLIVFGDQDKDLYYKLFEMKKEEVLSAMKDVVKETGSKSDFKYLLGNPFLALMYYIIRYFTYHKDVKVLNACLGMFAIDVYWSIFTKYFPNGIIEPVMNYTIDNLTDKFIIKKAGTIFGALTESARRSYGFHEQKIKDGRDADCVSFMQRIRNDQNSMFRTLSTIYYKNHKEGNAIATRNDDYDPSNPILDDVHTASTEIQAIVDKSCMSMISNGIDIALAEAASRMSNISISNLRIYLSKIFVNERLEEITTLVESMIFLFINESKRSIRDIKSQYFLYWSCALFKKTNSKDGNVIRINAILDKWGKDTGIYEAFRSDGSRINYKKAIFLYIAMSVQKYT